jgi:hypothetical protein
LKILPEPRYGIWVNFVARDDKSFEHLSITEDQEEREKIKKLREHITSLPPRDLIIFRESLGDILPRVWIFVIMTGVILFIIGFTLLILG